MTAIDAGANPEQASALAAILTADQQADFGAPPLAPTPADTSVDLPGGYLDLQHGIVAKTAEVRELNGEDEEAISRAITNIPKYFDAILARGVVSIGEIPATKQILDSLLVGDRDMLLVGIRRATFGDDVEYHVTCPHCQQEQDTTVLLSRDLEVDTLDDPVNDSEWEMSLASGKTVTVGLPTGSVSKALAAIEDRNEGVLNTVLLSKTVKAINGFPCVGDGQVKTGLSIRDRREIIKEIGTRNPGPRFGEVSRPCSSCGESIPLPLSLLDLFLF